MSKRSPKLQFTDDELSAPKVKQAAEKATAVQKKLEKAEAKLPKKTVLKKQRAIDPKSGKVTAHLYFEEVDKKKPPSKLSHAVRDAPVNAVSANLHRKLHEDGDENSGTQAAIAFEETAEGGVRAAESAHRSAQLRPYRNAERLEAKADKANTKALYQDSKSTNPKLHSNPYSRFQQKQAIKKEYAAAKAGRGTSDTIKASETVSKAAEKATEATRKTGEFVARHKKSFLIIGGIAAALVILMQVLSSFSLLLQGGSGTVMGTYPLEDSDMLAAEAAYCGMEAELQEYLDESPSQDLCKLR